MFDETVWFAGLQGLWCWAIGVPGVPLSSSCCLCGGRLQAVLLLPCDTSGGAEFSFTGVEKWSGTLDGGSFQATYKVAFSRASLAFLWLQT